MAAWDMDGDVGLEEDNFPPHPDERPDLGCPKCGSTMVLRNGKFGPFFGCSTFPRCRGAINAKEAPERPRTCWQRLMEDD